jgi:negative regulator of sigma E activity
LLRYRRNDARNPHSAGFLAHRTAPLGREAQDIQLIYRTVAAQQYGHKHQSRCEQQNRRPHMFKNTVIALGAAVVLVTALGSASYAQQTQKEWWDAYQKSKSRKHCVGGEESAASAYPSWMVCNPR